MLMLMKDAAMGADPVLWLRWWFVGLPWREIIRSRASWMAFIRPTRLNLLFLLPYLEIEPRSLLDEVRSRLTWQVAILFDELYAQFEVFDLSRQGLNLEVRITCVIGAWVSLCNVLSRLNNFFLFAIAGRRSRTIVFKISWMSCVHCIRWVYFWETWI